MCDIIRHYGFNPSYIDKEKVNECGFGAEPIYQAIFAEIDKKIVGCAIYYIKGFVKELRLEELYITEECRNLGIGQALCHEVARYGAEEGCLRMDGDVSNKDKGLLNYYGKLGAEVIMSRSIVRLDLEAMKKLAER